VPVECHPFRRVGDLIMNCDLNRISPERCQNESKLREKKGNTNLLRSEVLGFLSEINFEELETLTYQEIGH
jgi:hypothetical protein